MGKLVTLLILVSLACRALSGQWPWQLWAGSERAQQEARARTLLGVNPIATRSEIGDAHRRLLTRVHPDRGGSNEAVYEANAARDLLLARLDRIEAKRS